MDVVMSMDGEVIVSHDIRLNPDIVRGTDGKFITDRKLVKSLSLKELKQYDVGRMNTTSAYSKFFPAQIGLDGVNMPTVFNTELVSTLIDWGVDGIITDDPGMLISMLAARNYSLPARY